MAKTILDASIEELKHEHLEDIISDRRITEEEKEIYENTKDDYDRRIDLLVKEVNNLNEWERNELVELEIFIDILNSAEEYYKKAYYVQKRKSAKILFLKIKINSKKEIVVQIKPELQTLFNPIWWDKWWNGRNFQKTNLVQY